MAFDADALSDLAAGYAKGMTSIRGRRVQRLLKREFAGADFVATLVAADGQSAVLGVSASGAALCASDGRGPHACVVRWRHAASEALVTRFDLRRDSLPAAGSEAVPIRRLGGQGHRLSVPSAVPPELRDFVAAALDTLA